MSTRNFHLGDILSVTTGRLLSPTHIGGVYDILNYMTGDNLYTHQLPRAADECKPALLRQHPRLAGIEAPADLDGKEAVAAWLATQTAIYGAHLPVKPLPPGVHAFVEPLSEMAQMMADRR